MYFPLRVHSHYSLLLSTLKIEDILEVSKGKYSTLALTDFTSVSGAISFYKECKENNIKPILGCEILVTEDPENKPSTLTLLCKNKEAWTTLLQIVSKSNEDQYFKRYPSIPMSELKKWNLKNFICIDGYDGSLFHHTILDNVKECYCLDSFSEIQDNLKKKWVDLSTSHIFDMEQLFDDYYLESSSVECCSDTNPLPLVLNDCLYKLYELYQQQSCELKIIQDYPVFYKDDIGAIDQRILLSSLLKTTLSGLKEKIENGKTIDARLNIFLKSRFFQFNEFDSPYHQEISDKCEEYNILSNPKLPKFTCPNGKEEIDYLKDLCREGWKNILKPSGVLKDKETEDLYRDRVLYELGVIEKASLAGYFLIVQDYVNHFRRKGVLVGPGRGSAAGCLVSYLLGITLIDPIVYGLSFERFYNSGRITEGKISLPDVDMDFPPEYREDAIAFLKNKYGPDKVCQMATFGRMQGRSALKEVLRINEYCGFNEMNAITSKLPSEAAISDLLDDMENPSVIMWTLEHHEKDLKEYCYLEDGKLKGDYAKAFEQAIRLEGTFKSMGKHAAGVVVCSEKLVNVCPMIKAARSSEPIGGMEMGSLEAAGLAKLDILGVSSLSKISYTCKE